MINQSIVDECGLIPSGMINVRHVHGESQNVRTFLIDVLLPNTVWCRSVRVALSNLSSSEILIGMDIIGQGDFAVTNVGGQTKFTFQIPSVADIDFVQEARPRPSKAKRQRNRM